MHHLPSAVLIGCSLYFILRSISPGSSSELLRAVFAGFAGADLTVAILIW